MMASASSLLSSGVGSLPEEAEAVFLKHGFKSNERFSPATKAEAAPLLSSQNAGKMKKKKGLNLLQRRKLHRLSWADNWRKRKHYGHNDVLSSSLRSFSALPTKADDGRMASSADQNSGRRFLESSC